MGLAGHKPSEDQDIQYTEATTKKINPGNIA